MENSLSLNSFWFFASFIWSEAFQIQRVPPLPPGRVTWDVLTIVFFSCILARFCRWIFLSISITVFLYLAAIHGRLKNSLEQHAQPTHKYSRTDATV